MSLDAYMFLEQGSFTLANGSTETLQVKGEATGGVFEEVQGKFPFEISSFEWQASADDPDLPDPDEVEVEPEDDLPHTPTV